MIHLTSQALQMVAWFLAIVELALMLYVLLLNPRHMANRAVAALFLVIMLNTLSVGLVLDPTPMYRVGLPIYVATTTAVVVGLMMVTVVLIRPELLPGRWQAGVRRIWLPVYGLLVYGFGALPIVLTLIDVLFGTRLWYTPPAGYVGGYVAIGEAAAGTISAFLRGPITYVMGAVPIVLLIYVLVRDRKASAVTRRLAWLLLAVQTAALVLMSTQRGPEITPLVVLIVGVLYTAVFFYAAFQQMISERRAQRGRLQTRLAALILVVTIPILAAVVLFNSLQTSSALEQQADEQLATTNRALAANLEIWLDLNLQGLRQLASLDDIISMDPERQKPILEAMAEAHPHMYLVSITDMKGMNVARSDDEAPKDYHDRLWHIGARNGADVTYQTLIGRTSGEPALVLSVPIRRTLGTIVGVAMFASDLDDITAEVKASTVGETGFSYVVDGLNQVVAHPIEEYAAEFIDLDYYPPVFALRSGQGGLVNFVDEEGVAWRAYASELPNGWAVIVQQEEEELLATVRRMRGVAWGVIAVGGVLLAGLTLLVVRQMIQPISSLTETATAIAAGDLDRVAVVESEDEVGALARTFNSMTRQLRELIAGLEQQVAERTRELEQRSSYLQATADVGSAAASLLDRQQLIRQVVELIRGRFDLYYVGLFLIDEAGEWAVLEAGTGEAGKAMLARGHQIRVGEGMVGWSVARGNWRIAAEAEADAVRLATPELPLTRSEAALPLRSRGRTLGALTVQHTAPGAFDPDTMAVLQTMADQVAVALDNAALFAESQESLRGLRRAYGEASRQSWAELARARPDWGYRYTHGQVSPAEGEPWPEMVQVASRGAGPGTLQGAADRAMSRGGNGEDVPPSGEGVPPSGEGVPPSGEHASGSEVEAPAGEGKAPRDGDRSLAIPIRVRDQPIGVLGFRKRAGEGAWTPEEIGLLETMIAQLEVALESARLYQDTQRRAAEEQLLGEVTARMRETLDVDTVLQTAIQEIGAALGLSRVEVRMGEPRVSVGEGGKHVAAD